MVIWWRVVEELFFLWHSATSSLYRKQHSEVTSAMIVRSNFKCPQFFIVHFGSKIIQLSNGVTEDRLAILFSSPKIIQSQFAGSSVIPNGTVAAQSTALDAVRQRLVKYLTTLHQIQDVYKERIHDWNVYSTVASNFDDSVNVLVKWTNPGLVVWWYMARADVVNTRNYWS